MTSDAELFAAAMAGGPEAFAPIIQHYQDAVFGIALARLGNFHEAEDIAQQVFVAAFERLGNLKDPARLGAWLRTMTIHDCIDHLRRRRQVADFPAAAAHPGHVSRPDVALERRELRNHLLTAIGRLSKTQRETTALFYINGYSISQVAGIQEVPAGTIKRRLHDAREKLKEDMIGMVEHVLKSEAPKDDFGEQVFQLLSQPGIPAKPPWSREWREIREQLRKIGNQGVEGFIRAFESAHSPTRILVTRMVHDTGQTDETVIDLLKRGVQDPNRKVRMFATEALLWLKIDRERIRNEFLPMIFPLLQDRSKNVRRELAYKLLRGGWAKDVPLELIVRTFVSESRKSHGARGYQEDLMRAILDARDTEQNQE